MMSSPRSTASSAEVSAFKRLAIRFGAALLVLGILACMSLILMDRLTTFEVSMVMLAAGLLQISHSVAGCRRGWSAFAIAGSIFYLLAAVAVLVKPLALDGWADWLLVVSLGCSGLSRIRASVGLPASSARWEILSGVISIVAAALINFGLPGFSLWPIAFIVALDIIIEGAALANAGYAMSNDSSGSGPGKYGAGGR